MKIDITPKPKKNLYTVHNWFAWHPIRVVEDDKIYWVWLTTVERHRTMGCYPLYIQEKWVYSLVKTPLHY